MRNDIGLEAYDRDFYPTSARPERYAAYHDLTSGNRAIPAEPERAIDWIEAECREKQEKAENGEERSTDSPGNIVLHAVHYEQIHFEYPDAHDDQEIDGQGGQPPVQRRKRPAFAQ